MKHTSLPALYALTNFILAWITSMSLLKIKKKAFGLDLSSKILKGNLKVVLLYQDLILRNDIYLCITIVVVLFLMIRNVTNRLMNWRRLCALDNIVPSFWEANAWKLQIYLICFRLFKILAKYPLDYVKRKSFVFALYGTICM